MAPRHFALLALPFALAALPAQSKTMTFASASERMGTRIAVFTQDGDDFAALAQACIQYEAPAWKDEYDGMADQAKGKSLRLGKNFWTTLDTNVPMSIGETKVPAGQWYLGLSCSEKGDWALMVMSADKVRQFRFDGFETGKLRAKINAPLTYAKTEKKVAKLTIELQKDEKVDGAGTLILAWGEHKLSAPVKLDLDAARAAAAKAKSKGDDDDDDEEGEEHGEKKAEPKKPETKKEEPKKKGG